MYQEENVRAHGGGLEQQVKEFRFHSIGSGEQQKLFELGDVVIKAILWGN